MAYRWLATAFAMIVAAGLCASLAIASGCGSTAPPTYRFSFAEQRAELEGNGLRVVVLPDHTTDLVEVDVRYHVGSSADPQGKAGLAHLVEHLMFLQRPEGPGTPSLMHYIGQLATSFNASTSWDSTHYMMMSRKENLESMLQIEAMRMFYGCQTITAEEFEREREVVRNEIRQRTGTGDGQIFQLLLSSVYPQAHPYRRLIGGNDHELSSITLADACEFMARHYVPANATVIVAGNTDRDQVAALMQRWFGKLPRKPAPPPLQVAPPVLARKQISHDVAVERPRLYVAWALPPATTRDGDDAAYAVATLTSRVAYFGSRWEFATDVVPQILGGELAPIFVIAVELRKESDRGKALEFIWKAARTVHEDIDSELINDIKPLLRADFIKGLEALPSRTYSIADWAQTDDGIAWTSEEQFWERRFREIDTLDGDRLSKVIERVLDPGKAVIVDIKATRAGLAGERRAELRFVTRSHEDERRDVDVDPAEARRPLALPAVPDALGKARWFELDNGMRVGLLPFSSMPVVSALLVFGVGSAHEPANQAGLAQVAARMLLPAVRGAPVVDTRAFADADHTFFLAQGMNIYLDLLIERLERRTAVGLYSQSAIEDWRQQVAHAHESRRHRDELAFDAHRRRAIHGKDHPYAVQGEATPETAARIGRDAAMSFKETHYSARNATLVIAGQFDMNQAEWLIREHFGDWSGGHVDEPVAARPARRDGPAYIGVVADKGAQMSISIAYPGPAGVGQDHAARLVLEQMLDIRMGDVRHELGATYGIKVRRPTRMGGSMYEISGEVDIERAGESLRAMREGIAALRAGYEGFDADFVRARRKVVQELLGQSTVSAQVAAQLSTIARYRLSPSHYRELIQQVARLTPEQVKALLATELLPEHQTVVIMADRETMERAFADAGIENPELVEPQ